MSWTEAVKNIAKEVYNSEEAKVATTKSAVGISIAGVTLNEWVAIASFTYFVLQIGFLIRRELRKGKCSACEK